MNKTLKISLATSVVFVLAIFGFSSTGHAFGIPAFHIFYGNVTWPNGSLVGNGVRVFAIMNGTIKADTATSNGSYGYETMFMIDNASDGDLIEFYLNNSARQDNAINYTFRQYDVTVLDLMFPDVCGDGYCASQRLESCSNCPSDCGTCPQPPPGDDRPSRRSTGWSWAPPECTGSEARPCGNSTGRCQPGMQTCQNGQWSECAGGINPIREICNNVDDDCDSLKDEGLRCECLIGQTKPCGLETGVCLQGYRMCSDGRWSDECYDEVSPTKEVCDNNLDDDCDGKVDEPEECINETSIICEDGWIKEPCRCGDRIHTEGYCFKGYHFKINPLPPLPWELLSILGALVISILLILLGIKEIIKFRRIHKLVSMQEQEKAKMPAKEEKAKIMDIKIRTEYYLGKMMELCGRVKMSSYVSANEFWYSFYDNTGAIALHSTQKLEQEYVKIKVRIQKTTMGHLYAELISIL